MTSAFAEVNKTVVMFAAATKKLVFVTDTKEKSLERINHVETFLWRRRRDSNPRTAFNGYTISSRARSTNYATSPKLS